jgi:hypothetical protein
VKLVSRVRQSRYQRHRKRESQHDVIGCDALRIRIVLLKVSSVREAALSGGGA